jgi:hypothetical protein
MSQRHKGENMKKIVLALLLVSGVAYAKGLSVGVTSKGINSYGLSVVVNNIQAQVYMSQAEVALLFFEKDLVSFLGVYAGAGASVGWGSSLSAAAIVPVGLEIHLGKMVDLFGEVVPQYSVMPSMGFGYGYNGGLRVNF